MTTRLDLALASLEDFEGRVLHLNADACNLPSELPPDRLTIVSHDAIETVQLQRLGVDVHQEVPPQTYDAAIVSISKAKALTLALIHQAVSHAASVVVDGQKDSGIAAILKLCRTQFDVGTVVSKAHGKAFGFPAQNAPSDWAISATEQEGFLTYPGVFSADGIDPGSCLLSDYLVDIEGSVCDLGAGWGYLSACLLERSPRVGSVDMVEANWLACKAARENVSAPRAAIHWADATTWEGRYDWVISNPPFHQGRATTPDLGRAFIKQAVKILKPNGKFRMVANRHLAYEEMLSQCFSRVEILAQEGGYKVIEAVRGRA